jgi:hypothetical protein
VDLQMPADFPHATYMAVEGRISHHLEGRDAGKVAGFSGYAGGWNGLAVRFRAADEYAARAIHLLTTLPGSPPNEDRYAEESALFGFFANAVASVESPPSDHRSAERCCRRRRHAVCGCETGPVRQSPGHSDPLSDLLMVPPLHRSFSRSENPFRTAPILAR